LTETLKNISIKLRRLAAELPYVPRTLALVWVAAKYWTVAWVILILVQGLLPVATVYLTKWVVDSLVAAVKTGGAWESLRPLLVQAGLMAAVLLLTQLLSTFSAWVRAMQGELLSDHVRSLIHKKSIAADMAFFELPDFYDHLHRARAEAGSRPLALLESLGGLLQNGITLFAMGGLLIRFGVWLPAALILSALPAFYVVLRQGRREHQWHLRTTADERRAWYYDWLLTARETAAEVRLFDLGSHFQSAYQVLRKGLRDGRLALAKQQSWATLGASVLGLVVTGGAICWMVNRAFHGRASFGDLALFYQAFNTGQQMMRSLLQNAGQIYANTLFLGNLFEFLELRPQVVDPTNPVPAPTSLQQGIRFQNVTFRYAGSGRFALTDFNLSIPAGKMVALVGPNGAGKSTLIKLLCRFYDPDEGRIELDGIDLSDMPIDDLRRRITVLFQEPVHYNATVAENIAVGGREKAVTRAEIEAAAGSAGASECIARLPQQYQNLLGMWFEGGAELSVGEWQRIALARAFLRQAPILLLDEPTSAMDSWAEVDWLERFRVLARGHTVLIITHRFTTAMRADTIHVMTEGRIVESGTHDQLIALAGLYAQSWTAQMRNISARGFGSPDRSSERGSVMV
jgi:ATP-binding cassette, subfamily B, bacterial